VIKEYFANYFLHQSDVTIDLEKNSMEIHQSKAEPWKITLIDTGFGTMTGGRIKRVQDYVGNSTFMLTYGDGVGNVDLTALLALHKAKKKLATVTSVQPSGRFGALNLDSSSSVLSFQEKPKGDGSWINGGFLSWSQAYSPTSRRTGPSGSRGPLRTWRRTGSLRRTGIRDFGSHGHARDKINLENLWNTGTAPWKVWE